MAAHKYALSQETYDALQCARDLLQVEVESHRDCWDAASERWQEGDRGDLVDTWIDTLDELLLAIEGCRPRASVNLTHLTAAMFLVA